MPPQQTRARTGVTDRAAADPLVLTLGSALKVLDLLPKGQFLRILCVDLLLSSSGMLFEF